MSALALGDNKSLTRQAILCFFVCPESDEFHLRCAAEEACAGSWAPIVGVQSHGTVSAALLRRQTGGPFMWCAAFFCLPSAGVEATRFVYTRARVCVCFLA